MKDYRITSEMIRFFKNPYDALDNIYKELFVQEYSKPPDTTGGVIFNMLRARNPQPLQVAG